MILDTILAAKAREVNARKAERPLAELVRAAELAPPARDFTGALRRGGAATDGRAMPVAVIAEVKKASPSKGLIRPDFDPAAIARSYAAGGAAALSVLTDAEFFQGRLDYLGQARSAVTLPALRKDFTIDPYQIYEARAAGADAILLIVSAFIGPAAAAAGRTPAELAQWRVLAESLGMVALVEVHTAAEFQVATDAGAILVGINNRDLRTFATDLAVTERLAGHRQPHQFLVSESGIATTADLQRLHNAGAGAVLVGESLMRQPDPAHALRRLLGVRGEPDTAGE